MPFSASDETASRPTAPGTGPHDGTRRNTGRGRVFGRRAHVAHVHASLGPHPGCQPRPPDGARWPRCDAPELELPSLVGSLEPDPDTMVRVTVDLAEWPDTPYTVMAPDRVIAVEPSGPRGETHAISLDCGSVGRWLLLVVPPDEPAGTAARLPAAAADPENPPHPSASR
ncbi:DUF5994 family protein [Streptomyces sp. NPDC001817]|uniref:DUF5994 family protein n=1 Tax=Streptomyces sp. NPDC001817 TaxID=3154398 RepID=UPI003316BB93